MMYEELVAKVNLPELVKALRLCQFGECGCGKCYYKELKGDWCTEDNHHEFFDCDDKLKLDAAAAIEKLQAEAQFYKYLAEEWQETADRKERLLGMYRAQNIYSAKDSSGHLITNLCSLNRSEIQNS